MKNHFSTGEIVVDRIRPSQRLMITRFANQLYYCKVEENTNRKELVYLEGDLKSFSQNKDKLTSVFKINPQR